MQEFSVTRAFRVERPDGKTSPEKLVAAAQASCYAVALSHPLAGQEAEIDEIKTEAVATLDAYLLRITAVDLEIWVPVSGLSQGQMWHALFGPDCSESVP